MLLYFLALRAETARSSSQAHAHKHYESVFIAPPAFYHVMHESMWVRHDCLLSQLTKLILLVKGIKLKIIAFKKSVT